MAFICHASEDNGTTRRLAEEFHARGIDTFFDEWEIGPGDSLRQKIDSGLTNCTHFVVLLTPTSIKKPWVNAEIDAAFIRKLDGRCKFIPLRYNLSVDELPPLLKALHSPEFDGSQQSLGNLVDFIHGLSKKPLVVNHALTTGNFRLRRFGLSVAAEAIARLFIERSENGYAFDPQLEPDDIRAATGLSDDSIVDAIDELEERGFVQKHTFLGDGEIGFGFVTPEARLFSELDSYFFPWSPEEDAKKVAVDLMNGADSNVRAIAEKNGWLPRRMNPAVAYLVDRGLVESSDQLGTAPWCTAWIGKTHATRRWVQSFS
jgi:hypothetical protein